MYVFMGLIDLKNDTKFTLRIPDFTYLSSYITNFVDENIFFFDKSGELKVEVMNTDLHKL